MNDKARLARAFTALRREGYLASGRAGFTRQEAYRRLVELRPEHAERLVYYTDQGEADAFDSQGNLRKTLHLYWAGEPSTLRSAFRHADLEIDAPNQNAISLHPNPAALQTTFESVCEAAGRRYGLATGRPESSETIYENLGQEAALFRAWLSEQIHELFLLMELDREVCVLDDIYERYVGFGLPGQRGH